MTLELALTTHYHAVVWIDHHEARIIYLNDEDADETIVHAPNQNHHIHSKSGSPSGTHLVGDPIFFRKVADAVAAAREIYVVGPAAAKTEFMAFVHAHAAAMFPNVIGVETMDKVSDAELVQLARRYFKAADRMRPQIQRP